MDNERLKRIALIVGFVVISVGLGYLLYRMFFQPAVPTVPAGKPETIGGQLPSAGSGTPGVTTPTEGGGLPEAQPTEGGVTTPAAPAVTPGVPSRTTVLTQNFTQAISPSTQGNGVRSFNPDDGKFYRISGDGTIVPLSDQVFYNVDRVTWGNQTDKAVLEYPDGSKILYDFTRDKQVTLPSYWEDFQFSPQDDKIALKSVGNNDTNRYLVVSNPDGTGAVPVQELGDNQDKVHVSWSPNNQVIAYSFTGEPLDADRQQIILLGQHHENFKGLIVEGRGFVPNWSPSGNNLLYSVYSQTNNYLPELWISGASGNDVNANRHRLELNTWADMCVWHNETTLFCAVPNGLDTGAGLQRDLFNNLPDNIVRIDLSTGMKTDLGKPDGNPAISQMSVSADGQYLFFTDRATGRLSRFNLSF